MRYRLDNWLAIALIGLCLLGCDIPLVARPVEANFAADTPPAAGLSRLEGDDAGGSLRLPAFDGIWQTAGEGLLLTITDGEVAFYEQTEVSCLLVERGSSLTQTLLTENGYFLLSRTEDQLHLQSDSRGQLIAHRLATLPSLCQKGGSGYTANPIQNFEVLWHTFDEHYAFFARQTVDWQATYDQYRPQVTAAMPERALFDLLVAMLEPLQDGHVGLYNPPYRAFSAGTEPPWATSIPDYLQVIRRRYLRDGVKTTANEQLFYGLVRAQHAASRHSVGYINILSLLNFAEEAEAEGAAIDQAMQQILADWQEVEAIIIDLRFNRGGYDDHARRIASYFAEKRRLAFFKQTRHGDAFTAPQPFYLEPRSDTPFTRPVIVLTSRLTFSAAETLVLYLSALPHVTVIGGPTGGGLSDRLTRELPNGWVFSLSNQQRLTLTARSMPVKG